MKLNDIPKLMPVPFGVNGPREEIRDESLAGQPFASYSDGFPPITMLMKQAGGLPPQGKDMNQILFELASGQRWSNSGAGYKFNKTFSEAVGGYPKGAQLLSNDGTKVYVSIKDDNKTDFNTSPGPEWVTLGDYIGLGDYATKTDVESKLDKTAVVQNVGASTTSVISQDGQTKLFALKQSTDAFKSGNHTIVSGNDYTYVELVNSDGERLSLETLPQNEEFSGNLILRNSSGDAVSVNKIPKSSNGVLAIRSDLAGYQPVGDYATKTELNEVDNKAVQSFRYSSVRVTNTAVDTWSPAAEGEFLIGIRTALDGGGIWIVTAVKVATLQMRVGGQWVSVKNA